MKNEGNRLFFFSISDNTVQSVNPVLSRLVKMKLSTMHLIPISFSQGIATGKYHAAVLCNTEEGEKAAIEAGRSSGDMTFPLCYCPELHFSEFNSVVADMKNSVAVSSIKCLWRVWGYSIILIIHPYSKWCGGGVGLQLLSSVEVYG